MLLLYHSIYKPRTFGGFNCLVPPDLGADRSALVYEKYQV